VKKGGPLDFEIKVSTSLLPPFKEQIRQLLSAIPNPAFNALHGLLTLSPNMFIDFLAGWVATNDPERFKEYYHFHKCFSNAIKDLDTVVVLPDKEASILKTYLPHFSRSGFSEEL
jgi:hypothetical protein